MNLPHLTPAERASIGLVPARYGAAGAAIFADHMRAVNDQRGRDEAAREAAKDVAGPAPVDARDSEAT